MLYGLNPISGEISLLEGDFATYNVYVAKSSSVIVGRESEREILQGILESSEAEFLAVYGRRRVGKTHLVREFFKPRVKHYFEVSGEHGAKLATQLHHFRDSVRRSFGDDACPSTFESWPQALGVLADLVEALAKTRGGMPIVLFFDELPWLSTRRSGFVPALDHCWNARLGQIRAVKLVVCGSAASWMLDHFVHAKGGLYNRVTRLIDLRPFNLAETELYLRSRGIRLDRKRVMDLYLALGGVPHYLKQVTRGRSVAQAIGDVCFDRNGLLHEEFPRLFESLFAQGDAHEAIVRELGRDRSGLTRNELVARTASSSGGRLKKRLEELEHSGFVGKQQPFGKLTKDTRYRVIDEYCQFYLRWIERAPKGALSGEGAKYWTARATTSKFASWAGYAFETLCMKHSDQLRQALGILEVPTEISSWRYLPQPGSKERGAQIDLVLDRDDDTITLCEMKYTMQPFKIDKGYALDLRRKIEVFQERTGTRKQLFLVLVTPYGLHRNVWSEDLVDAVVTADSLFELI